MISKKVFIFLVLTECCFIQCVKDWTDTGYLSEVYVIRSLVMFGKS